MTAQIVQAASPSSMPDVGEEAVFRTAAGIPITFRTLACPRAQRRAMLVPCVCIWSIGNCTY